VAIFHVALCLASKKLGLELKGFRIGSCISPGFGSLKIKGSESSCNIGMNPRLGEGEGVATREVYEQSISPVGLSWSGVTVTEIPKAETS
jgi:hypothetical protein